VLSITLDSIMGAVLPFRDPKFGTKLYSAPKISTFVMGQVGSRSFNT